MGLFSSIGKVLKKGVKAVTGAFTGGSLGSSIGNLAGMIPGVGSVLGPAVTSLLGGVTGGDVLQGVAGYMGQKKADEFSSAQAMRSMQFSADQAQKNRDFTGGQATQQMAFQERMRNTAYQTAMDDMKKAGLNPILAYKQGGAAVPSGASGSGSQASGAQSVGGNRSAAALAMAHSAQALRNAKAAEQQTLSQTTLNETETSRKFMLHKILDKQSKILDTQLNSANLNLEVKKTAFDHIKKSASIRSNNPWLQYLGIATDEISKLFGSGNSAKQFFLDSPK